MRTEPAEVRTGGAYIHSPMQVAQHPLFTPQEKIEMLEEMRAGVSNIYSGADGSGFEADEIDEAVAAVRLSAQSDLGSADSLRGDAR